MERKAGGTKRIRKKRPMRASRVNCVRIYCDKRLLGVGKAERGVMLLSSRTFYEAWGKYIRLAHRISYLI